MFNKIAAILRETENIDCINKAESLDAQSGTAANLHLRSLGLKSADIIAIASALSEAKDDKNESITSISLSYNDATGDEGAIAIAKSLPNTIREIGLVGCGIGDKGGTAILSSLKTYPSLKMICIEQNNFSEPLKREFETFRKLNPGIIVVF
jgi:hypothetical protein